MPTAVKLAKRLGGNQKSTRNRTDEQSVLEEERSLNRTLLKSSTEKEKESKGNYLEDWKSSQEEMNKKIRFLIEENERLLNEVDQLKIRLYEELDKKTLASST